MVMHRSEQKLGALGVLLIMVVAAFGVSVMASTAEAANDPTQFGVSSFTTSVVDDQGADQAQAASHPFSATAAFSLNTMEPLPSDTYWSPINVVPVEDPRTVEVDLPAGFVGNPMATPVRCTAEQLSTLICPVESQVGSAKVGYNGTPANAQIVVGVYNMVPSPGYPAELGMKPSNLGVAALLPSVRSDGDFGLVIRTPRILPSAVFSTSVTLWGVPADPAHDPERLTCFFGGFNCQGGTPSTAPKSPFLTNPATLCPTDRQPVTRLRVDSWQHPGQFKEYTAASPKITGCDKLTFEPSVDISPTVKQPDAPTGLNVDMAFPQEDNAEGLAPPALKKAVVTFPEGMTINPSGANGLQACADAELKLKSKDPVTCPDAAKVGTVTAKSPLLEEELTGGVYVRSQSSFDPESGEMFRIALVLENKERGLSIRLPGEIRANKDTGRLETTFDNNPELPVSNISLRFKDGPRRTAGHPADVR